MVAIKKRANISASMENPIQTPPNGFPAWRLPRGTINATETQLENASSSCERCEWACAGLVAVAVIAEFVIAALHPPYNSSLERWGSAVIDSIVALGIVGEVIFSRKDSGIQTELRKRSNDKLGAAEKTAGEAHARAKHLEKEAADARARTAATELRLEELRQRVGARNFDRQKFLGQLNGKSGPGIVQIRYDRSVPDGWSTGVQLYDLLRAAKWEVTEPLPIEEGSPLLEYVPRFMERGAQNRVIGTGAGIVVVFAPGTVGSVHDEARLAITNAIAFGLNNGLSGRDGPIAENEIMLLIFARS